MNSFFSRLAPFIYLGIMLAILIAGIVIFSYLLILGALLGVVLFSIAWIKERFFSSKKRQQSGRIIEHDQ